MIVSAYQCSQCGEVASDGISVKSEHPIEKYIELSCHNTDHHRAYWKVNVVCPDCGDVPKYRVLSGKEPGWEKVPVLSCCWKVWVAKGSGENPFGTEIPI